MRNKAALLIVLTLLGLIGAGCSPGRNLDNQLRPTVRPYQFDLAGWEFKTLSGEIKRAIVGKDGWSADDVGPVIEYYSVVDKIRDIEAQIAAIRVGQSQSDLAEREAELSELKERKAALSSVVEDVIGQQMAEILAQQGIFNPADECVNLRVRFPPVLFKLETPPDLLVISPRERIESIREIRLQPDISLAEKEDIEARIDELGVSSLVVPLGGIATYPSFVADDTGLRFALDAVAEEWVHQYLAFKPLGFLYLLDLTGIARNYEIATMNETLASMVAREIGSMVRQRYYAQFETDKPSQADEAESEFNREMRETREAVDALLARGEIEQAEVYMEQKRQYLASRGYYIRKLNQAYFAFYGAYADSPASISPIGPEMEQVRSQSDTLKAFLNTVAAMTSREDLRLQLSLH